MHRISRNFYILIYLLLVAGAGSGLRGQERPVEKPVGLDEAVTEALARNGDLDAARARTTAERARAREAASFLYPILGLEAGGLRSDDPVTVFGTRLRQERFGQADFAVESLNRPDPITDWTAAAGVTWKILDPAAWSGREAAAQGARASELELERRREATVFRTRVLYLRAVAARARLDAADRGLEATRASRDAVRERADQGLLTEAEVLDAESRVAAARAGVADARRSVRESSSRLGAHLGWSSDTVPAPREELLGRPPAVAVSPGARAGGDVTERADLRALERAGAAADARVSQAVRSRIPTLETFGRVSTHAPEIAGERTANWTVGVQLRWPAFTGFAREAGIDRARALRRAVEAEHGQRLREARAQVTEARGAVDAAAAAADAAEAALDAAAEARRLVRRRFEEGLTTADRLLRADARAAEMEARAIDARAAHHMAAARLDFALGATPIDP